MTQSVILITAFSFETAPRGCSQIGNLRHHPSLVLARKLSSGGAVAWLR
jgi:hypothetical protein